MDSPRDAATGLPTGKRQHKPFFFLKEIDKSTPLLRNAWANNENLTSCQLQCWAVAETAATGAGTEKQLYSITMTNASIASIVESMPDNEDPAKAKLPLQEQISLTYQKITWTWVEGGVTASDDWEAPVT